jgi:xylulokinase
MRLANTTPAHLARAAIEGLLCGLREGIAALERVGVSVDRLMIIGGGSRLEAVRVVAPTIFGRPVSAPPPNEYVANGAARQAAWALDQTADPPPWSLGESPVYEAEHLPWILERFREAQPLLLHRTSRMNRPEN